LRRQAADDAEVDSDVLRFLRLMAGDEDIARVHVRVEEAVTEHLGEEYFDAALGQLLHVRALGAQGVDIGHRDAADALHDQHLVAAPVPIDGRHIEYRRAEEVAPQQRGVGRLAIQVQLVEDGLLVIAYHFHRTQPPPLAGNALQGARRQVQPLDILMDDVFDPRAHDLDDYVAAVMQQGGMYLGDGSRGQWRIGKLGEYRFDRHAQLFFDTLACLIGGEGRYLVLQEGQFDGDVVGQQIAAGRQDLAELDEHRAQAFQGQAQAQAAAQVPGGRIQFPWPEQHQPDIPG